MIIQARCYYCGKQMRTPESLFLPLNWFYRRFCGCTGMPFGFTAYVHYQCERPLLQKLAGARAREKVK